MSQSRRLTPTTIAIYVVAALLLANLVAMLSRGRSGLPSAFAEQPPIAGGAGIFVMPAQLSSNMWGCYLLDVDTGTLCVYQFSPANKTELKFLAARDYKSDRRLKNFNTSPAPEEIKDLVDRQNKAKPADAPPAGGQ